MLAQCCVRAEDERAEPSGGRDGSLSVLDSVQEQRALRRYNTLSDDDNNGGDDPETQENAGDRAPHERLRERARAARAAAGYHVPLHLGVGRRGTPR